MKYVNFYVFVVNVIKHSNELLIYNFYNLIGFNVNILYLAIKNQKFIIFEIVEIFFCIHYQSSTVLNL